jgi:Uncharacterised protein family (UPF0175)
VIPNTTPNFLYGWPSPPLPCYPFPMQITVQLPDDLAQHPNAAREALEAFAIEGYRSGVLSSYQTRLLLGFETRYELDGFLKEHEVWDHAYSVEDLEKDAAGFERNG